MDKHAGKILASRIKSSGFNTSEIAKRLEVSRTTLYNRFEAAVLNPEFIFRVGLIIGYDFSDEFPELREWLKQQESQVLKKLASPYTQYESWKDKELQALRQKYTQLLERHNRLMNFLVKVANDNEFHSLKKEISQFL